MRLVFAAHLPMVLPGPDKASYCERQGAINSRHVSSCPRAKTRNQIAAYQRANGAITTGSQRL